MKSPSNVRLGVAVFALAAAGTLASLAIAAPSSAPAAAPTLVSVHGQSVCGTPGHMVVEATIEGGSGGGGTVFVKSTRGWVSSAAFTAQPHQKTTVSIVTNDASCSPPASYDVWINKGGVHKGLVVGSVTFVEGPPPQLLPATAGSGSLVGSSSGGG